MKELLDSRRITVLFRGGTNRLAKSQRPCELVRHEKDASDIRARDTCDTRDTGSMEQICGDSVL